MYAEHLDVLGEPFLLVIDVEGVVFFGAERTFEQYRLFKRLEEPQWMKSENMQRYKKCILDYLEGASKAIVLPISSVGKGTEFQEQVWQGLLTIPHGQTISYGELAEQLGCPSSVRAVATAVGKNPLLLIRPCHRVIRASGELGEYAGGRELKKRVIEWEKEVVKTHDLGL